MYKVVIISVEHDNLYSSVICSNTSDVVALLNLLGMNEEQWLEDEQEVIISDKYQVRAWSI
jgi:hypothetical protein